MTTWSTAPNFGHQCQIAKELETFSNEMFHGRIRAESEFTLKDTIFFGLADKNCTTFHSIRVLLEMELADDALALVRVLTESTVNAVYICFSNDDGAAEDYRDFPDFFEWEKHRRLAATNPEAVKHMSAEKVKAMELAFEACKSRFRKGQRSWCKLSLFDRVTAIDKKLEWSVLSTVVNSAWHQASKYVHGAVESIMSRVKERDGGIIIHRQVTPLELGAAMYAANSIMFVLLAFVDFLGRHHTQKWDELRRRWAGESRKLSRFDPPDTD